MKTFWYRVFLTPSGILAVVLLGYSVFFAVSSIGKERGPYTDPSNAAWTLLSFASLIGFVVAFLVSAIFALTRMPMTTIWAIQLGVALTALLAGYLVPLLLRAILT